MQPVSTQIFIEDTDGDIQVEIETEAGIYTARLKEISIVDAAQAQVEGKAIYMQVDYETEWPLASYDFVESKNEADKAFEGLTYEPRRFVQGALVITPRMSLIG